MKLLPQQANRYSEEFQNECGVVFMLVITNMSNDMAWQVSSYQGGLEE